MNGIVFLFFNSVLLKASDISIGLLKNNISLESNVLHSQYRHELWTAVNHNLIELDSKYVTACDELELDYGVHDCSMSQPGMFMYGSLSNFQELIQFVIIV